MGTTISAVYEQGALRLLEPVTLPESSRVQVQILSRDTDVQTPSFTYQLMNIRRLLTSLEAEWNNDLIREVFPQLLQTDLQVLWHLCQPPHRTLCAMLQLAATHIQAARLTHAQVAALRFVLDQLATPSLTDGAIHTCYEQLTSAGLPPSFVLNAETVQSYLDEL